MTDRGIIKWQPFNSWFNANDIIKNITNQKEKEKVTFPTLSDDQLLIIENKIKNAYILKLNINIEYYYDYEIKTIYGKIKCLDFQEHKLYLNNKEIYFNQIIKVL